MLCGGTPIPVLRENNELHDYTRGNDEWLSHLDAQKDLQFGKCGLLTPCLLSLNAAPCGDCVLVSITFTFFYAREFKASI